MLANGQEVEKSSLWWDKPRVACLPSICTIYIYIYIYIYMHIHMYRCDPARFSHCSSSWERWWTHCYYNAFNTKWLHQPLRLPQLWRHMIPKWCIQLCMCMYAYIYIYTSLSLSISLSLYIYIYIHTHTSTHIWYKSDARPAAGCCTRFPRRVTHRSASSLVRLLSLLLVTSVLFPSLLLILLLLLTTIMSSHATGRRGACRKRTARVLLRLMARRSDKAARSPNGKGRKQ